MESNDLRALSELYLKTVYEQKSESPEKEEEKMKKDDDLAGSPNKKKNGKKADKDYDGDGKVESSKDEYFGSKDKAIKKAMGKKVEEAVYGKSPAQVEGERRKKDNLAGSPLVVTNADKKANTKAYQNLKAGVKGYKAADHMKEEQLQEKQKDTPDQVAAVIDMYRSKKGTDAATYDSMHGKKKEAKKERDYAKFERDKMARDAQKSGHPWKHAKGSTTEKEGKKSVKHAHVQDSYDWQTESVEAEKYLETVSQVKDAELQADINRWETLQSKGFSTEEIKSVAWEDFDENYQAMRNPEKEEKKDTRSAKQKRMDSPDRGINSPAFKEFMRQQGMG